MFVKLLTPHIVQETLCEQKHSKTLFVSLPPLTRLPILHKEDEALARTGSNVTYLKVFLDHISLTQLLQGPLFTCDSGEVSCPSKGKKELASSGENRCLSFVQQTNDIAFSAVPAIAITITTVRDNFGSLTQPKTHQKDHSTKLELIRL